MRLNRASLIALFLFVASIGAQASFFEDVNSDKETEEDEKGPPIKVKKYDKNALCIKKLPEDMANGASCQHVWNMNPSEYQPYIPFDEDYQNDTEEQDDLICFTCTMKYTRYDECSVEEPKITYLQQCFGNDCPGEYEVLTGPYHAVRRCSLGMTDLKLTCPNQMCYVVIPCSVDKCIGYSGSSGVLPGLLMTLFLFLRALVFSVRA